eukprot:CAMPEP_0185735782 /NCGR_PEP_ID=MMETSP1171-20130828/26219_1 /TAXON_ID=374046 /ORGANISM="Helicotheca tamensis, Strain CCMP826" /LENGTH=264 /DNA_ID=CAMNT_0028406209 /DNA_START=74 /DNA_END=868 /DNA_ORIENTATION=+
MIPNRKRPSPTNLTSEKHRATSITNNQVTVSTSDGKSRQAILRLTIAKLMSLQPSLGREKAMILGKQLDAKLYQSAPSFQMYADKYTLDERLKKLATRVILAASRRSTATCFAGERRKLLRKKVGEGLYTEIMDHFQEIVKIRETNDTWTSVIQSKPIMSNGSETNISISKLMPSALRGIYFGPRLFEATKQLIAKTSSLQPERVENFNWEEMLQEARDNIAVFRDFEAVTKASEPESSGGFCTKFGCSASYPRKRQRIDYQAE